MTDIRDRFRQTVESKARLILKHDPTLTMAEARLKVYENDPALLKISREIPRLEAKAAKKPNLKNRIEAAIHRRAFRMNGEPGHLSKNPAVVRNLVRNSAYGKLLTTLAREHGLEAPNYRPTDGSHSEAYEVLEQWEQS